MQVNVALSTLMGGRLCNADAAMQSKTFAPEMTKRGYDLPFTAAVTAASSSISPVIPPHNLIIFALLANVSVHQMFAAGYVPAFLMALSLMVTIASTVRKLLLHKPSRSEPASAKERFHYFLKAIPALLIPFGIILGMRFGLFADRSGAQQYCFVRLLGFSAFIVSSVFDISRSSRETVQGTVV